MDRRAIGFSSKYALKFGITSRYSARLTNLPSAPAAFRTDTEPALFVSLKSPHKRLQISGIETRLREMGKRLNIPKVHPHKFRRTLATVAIDKGMPIEQLQQLLGHQRIDTTLKYAMVKQSNVKLAHKKYIG